MATRHCTPVVANRGDPSGTVTVGEVARDGHRQLIVNAVWNALTYVSGSRQRLDVVSLGLVYDVRHEDGMIVVEMALAALAAPDGERLLELARMAVAEAVGGAAPSQVRVVRDPPWSPAMIDTIAAEAAGA